MIWHIGTRELKVMFCSPLAWCILGVVQLLIAVMFLIYVNLYMQYQPQVVNLGVTEFIVTQHFSGTAIIFLLIIPVISMRLVSDERRNRTLSLLLSAPVTMTEIVLGKYLGLMLFMLILLGLVAFMPILLLLGGGLDFGLYFSGLLGLLFITASFSAVGLFMSTLTQQPAVAAISSFGALLLFWLMGVLDGGDAGLFSYLSILNHYSPFLEGKFDTTDAIYHLLFAATFIVLGVRRMDGDRLGA